MFGGTENMASDEEVDGGESSAAVEKTIETMETLHMCVHPLHKHSFTPVNFLISGPMRTCAGCEKRLNSVFGFGGPQAQVVRCVACYAYAHRSCAFSADPVMWKETCPVNSAVVGVEDAESTDGSEENALEQSGVLLVPQHEAIGKSRLDESMVHVQEKDEEEEEEEESNVLVESVESVGVSNITDDSFEDMKAPAPWQPSPAKSLADALSEDESGGSTSSALAEKDEDYVLESSPPTEPPVIISEEDHPDIDQNASDENIVHVQQEETVTLVDADIADEETDMSPFTQVRKLPSSSLLPQLPIEEESHSFRSKSPPRSQVQEDELIMVWTPEGPPRHWACEKSLEGIRRISPKAAAPDLTDQGETEKESSEETFAEPLHYEKHPFASVSRVLQENILPYFRQSNKKEEKESLDEAAGTVSDDVDEAASNGEDCSTDSKESSVEPDVDVKCLLTEVQPSPKSQDKSLVKMASGTLDAVKTSAQARKKLGLVSVAGGIAGGAAGLLVAGPAGAVIGAKFGQTAGVLGVILEGSVSVGVFVAGVAAASFTAQQLQQKEEKRILTLGRDENRKVLLVRPNVVVDPVWEDICAEAIKSSPSTRRLPFAILPNSPAKQADMAKRERNRRDSDIVETDEYEIPTEDKVLLLVSRSLNDKFSLPGHVYRYLIRVHRERSRKRQADEEAEPNRVDHDNGDSGEADPMPQKTPTSLRERRKDAHGVIKHVTATLLDVRPGFASSPKITEMSATAVEGLVFGELYDSVFEETVEETKVADELLMERIAAFENNQDSPENTRPLHWRDGISEAALKELRTLPDAHSAVDKLRICVNFLELISKQFSTTPGSSTVSSKSEYAQAINADSLLKMVCQHIIAAKVPHVNAEICFLEEFSRDEHLLRGKEGYALVTMQASLHFLNSSSDFESDIFRQDENQDRAVSVMNSNCAEGFEFEPSDDSFMDYG